jgi:hypothetical protein
MWSAFEERLFRSDLSGFGTVTRTVAIQADEVAIDVHGGFTAKRAVGAGYGGGQNRKLYIFFFIHRYSVLPARSSMRILFRSKQFKQNSSEIESETARPL